eukprot:9502738-Pyramimonas_sp.AAC.5
MCASVLASHLGVLQARHAAARRVHLAQLREPSVSLRELDQSCVVPHVRVGHGRGPQVGDVKRGKTGVPVVQPLAGRVHHAHGEVARGGNRAGEQRAQHREAVRAGADDADVVAGVILGGLLSACVGDGVHISSVLEDVCWGIVRCEFRMDVGCVNTRELLQQRLQISTCAQHQIVLGWE